jgi:hypothetical protein
MFSVYSILISTLSLALIGTKQNNLGSYRLTSVFDIYHSIEYSLNSRLKGMAILKTVYF